MNLTTNQMIVLAAYIAVTLAAWVRIWRHPEDNARSWQIVWSVFCAGFPLVGPLFFMALVEMPPVQDQSLRVRDRLYGTNSGPVAGGIPVLYDLMTGKGAPEGEPPESIQQTVAELGALAESGDPEAQAAFGAAYAEGFGVEKDYAAAVAWFRKAAEQGFALGQAELGAAYFDGTGIAPDEEQAYFWLRCAENRGEPCHADIRRELENTLSPDKVAELRQRAAEWIPSAPKTGGTMAG